MYAIKLYVNIVDSRHICKTLLCWFQCYFSCMVYVLTTSYNASLEYIRQCWLDRTLKYTQKRSGP